jgi:hypothetical protein
MLSSETDQMELSMTCILIVLLTIQITPTDSESIRKEEFTSAPNGGELSKLWKVCNMEFSEMHGSKFAEPPTRKRWLLEL